MSLFGTAPSGGDSLPLKMARHDPNSPIVRQSRLEDLGLTPNFQTQEWELRDGPHVLIAATKEYLFDVSESAFEIFVHKVQRIKRQYGSHPTGQSA